MFYKNVNKPPVERLIQNGGGEGLRRGLNLPWNCLPSLHVETDLTVIIIDSENVRPSVNFCTKSISVEN